MATREAYNTFRRVWGDPAGMAARYQYQNLSALYDYRWHLYQNSIFDDPVVWYRYRLRYGLYRYIRPIYNPVRRLVDFYAGVVYPGRLSIDGNRLPDGSPLAIPLTQDTPPALRTAIGQLWQWSNWQTGKNLFVRYGAALGDVGVEIVDDVDRGKVAFDIIWPGWVTELELDYTGNVKRVTYEYDTEDDEGKKYTYKKVMTPEFIGEYKDDEPFPYDEGVEAERDNPYGFVPFVWCKHTDLGNEHGSPAVRNVNKIDELNELASHAHDRAHGVMSSPIVASGQSVASLNSEALQTKQESTLDAATAYTGRETVKLIRTELGGQVSAVEIPEGEALNYMVKLIEEIERDHPELTMYNELRAMSQITGPAAERLVGDAIAYIEEARSNYDMQSIKLFQMGVAIAGWRANSGAWGPLDRQQQKFTPFDLESYDRGDLDFEIGSRPILANIRPTPDEQRALMEQAERGFATRAKVVEALGGSVEDLAIIDAEQDTQRQAVASMADEVIRRVRGVQQSSEADNE